MSSFIQTVVSMCKSISYFNVQVNQLFMWIYHWIQCFEQKTITKLCNWYHQYSLLLWWKNDCFPIFSFTELLTYFVGLKFISNIDFNKIHFKHYNVHNLFLFSQKICKIFEIASRFYSSFYTSLKSFLNKFSMWLNKLWIMKFHPSVIWF